MQLRRGMKVIKTSLKVLGHIAFTGFGFVMATIAVDMGMHWATVGQSVREGIPYNEVVLAFPGWTSPFVIVLSTASSFAIIFPVLWMRRGNE